MQFGDLFYTGWVIWGEDSYMLKQEIAGCTDGRKASEIGTTINLTEAIIQKSNEFRFPNGPE